MHRKVDNVHWTNYAASLGYGDHGGAYAQYDDGNPAWVDVDEEEDGRHDPEGQEACWRADDIENSEEIPSLEDMPHQRTVVNSYAKVCN